MRSRNSTPAYAGELAALAALCPGRVEKVSVTAIAIVRSRLAQVTSRGVSQTAISARKVSRRELSRRLVRVIAMPAREG